MENGKIVEIGLKSGGMCVMEKWCRVEKKERDFCFDEV